MQFTSKREITKWTIVAISFVIVALILWNTYRFFQVFKTEERQKMELWAKALKRLSHNVDVEAEVDLEFQIMQNATIPIVVVENDSIINSTNIDVELLKTKALQKKYLTLLKNQNDPLKIEYLPGKIWFFYYGDSDLINKLKYYPLALILIIVMFGTLVYNFYRTTKIATQNKLWAGMAKETAHQIGTPLSSLIGWTEIMKTEPIDQSIVEEIEKDITRLQTITDRFSKIGSEPVLEKCDIIEHTKNTFNYLTTRYSKQVLFSFEAPDVKVFIDLNPVLHSWTIENLMKNAVDATKGKGKIDLIIEKDDNIIRIKIKDNGQGISKKRFKNVFDPGVTTKKRGWGLGLSLTKRIVEVYHKGKVKVLNSEIGKGTTMQISYLIKKNN